MYAGTASGGEKGVAFLLRNRAQKALMKWIPISERVIAAKFKGDQRNIVIIQAYAPTADSNDDEIEAFYEQLEGQKMAKIRDLIIITGDFNAKIGSDNKGWEHVMGSNGIGEINERGERLLQFAQEKGLYICNTKYPST